MWLFRVGPLEGHGTSMAKQTCDIKKKKKFFLCSILLHCPRMSCGPRNVPGTIPPTLWPQRQGAPWTFTGQGRLAGAGGLESSYKSPFLFALYRTARLNLNDVAKQPRLNILNNTATALIFITVILNIFITAFGVQKTGLYPTRNFRPY